MEERFKQEMVWETFQLFRREDGVKVGNVFQRSNGNWGFAIDLEAFGVYPEMNMHADWRPLMVNREYQSAKHAIEALERAIKSHWEWQAEEEMRAKAVALAPSRQLAWWNLWGKLRGAQ